MRESGGSSNYNLIFLSLALVVSIFNMSCGFGGSSQSGAGGSNGSSTISFTWPEGYRYDSASKEISRPVPGNANYLPSYVTGAFITVQNSDGAAVIDTELALGDTMSLEYSLPIGTYTFNVMLTTSIAGLTFTGIKTVTLTPAYSLNLNFVLQVNAPPLLESVSWTSTTSRTGEARRAPGCGFSKGATIFVDAGGDGTASGDSNILATEGYNVDVNTYKGISSLFDFRPGDPDNDNVDLNFSSPPAGWMPMGGGTGSFQFQSSGATSSGNQTIPGMLDDGRGGTRNVNVNIMTMNRRPTATATFTPSSVSPGDTTTFTCVVDDADWIDRSSLDVTWFSLFTGSGTGSGTHTDTYTPTSSGTFTETCEARDGDVNNPLTGVATATLTVGSSGCTCAAAASFTPAGTCGASPYNGMCNSITTITLGLPASTVHANGASISGFGCTLIVNC